MAAVQPTVHMNIALIEVADKVTLDIILADAQSRRLILTRLSERVAAVVPGQTDALIAYLRKQGHLPKVTGGR
jgi:hypothetical protein